MTAIIPIPEVGGDKAISQTDGRLAWEIAAEISPIKDILTRYGLTTGEFQTKLKDKLFRSAIREAKILWKSDINVEQRIKLKARFLVEDSLLDIFAIIKNENMAAAPKLEAFEKLMRAADVVPRARSGDGNNPGTGFKISINLGDSQGVVIDGHAISQDSPVPA